MAVARHLVGHIFRCPKYLEFPIDRLRPLPVLELDGPQPMAQPLVQFSPDPGRLRQPEVRLPTQQVGPQFLHHLRHAARTRAACELPNADLEVVQCLISHCTFDFFALGHPQLIAQKLAPKGAGHRTLGFVDLKLQAAIQLPEQCHHPLARLSATHIDVAVIGVARKAVASRLQRLVHLVEQHVGKQGAQYAAYDLAYFSLQRLNWSNSRRR